MKQLIFYFLEANFYLLVFLAAFILLLRNEHNFKFKRFFLLFSIVLSVLLPIFNLSWPFQMSEARTMGGEQMIWLPEVVVSAGKSTSNFLEWFSTTEISTVLISVYFVGLAVFLTNFCIQLTKLIRLFSTADTYRWRNYRVIESKERNTIFSFFNLIFIGSASDLSAEEKTTILRHEQTHADHFHSLDIIICDLLIIFFWFNPLIRLYKKKLIQQHEFEADSRAVENSEVNDYCSLLARIALRSAGFSLANHFNNSLTIKRITMMQTTKKKIHKIKMAALILIFPAIAVVMACQKEAVKEDEQISDTKEPSANIVFTVVEQMPEFPGGMPKLGAFLGDNLKYPEASAKNGVEGIVYVSFIVGEDGTVREPKIEKGINAECDAEALRVISLSPKWNPGIQNGRKISVKMNLPIKFVQNAGQSGNVTTGDPSSSNQKFTIRSSTAMIQGKSTITGTVLDQNNNPVEGAIVVQMGTTRGAHTDANGNFSIEPLSPTGELGVSHVNFSRSTIPFDF